MERIQRKAKVVALAGILVVGLGAGVGVSTWANRSTAGLRPTSGASRPDVVKTGPNPEPVYVSADGSYVRYDDAAVSTAGPITRDD